MKSFVRNQSNIEAIRSDARFEALLKQEMDEHQSVISSHHKEMQELRDLVNYALDRCDTLYNHSDQKLKEKSLEFDQLISDLQIRMKTHDVFSSDQKKSIFSVFQHLNDFYSIYCKKTDLESFKKEIQVFVREAITTHISSFQNYEKESKILISSLKEDLIHLKQDMGKKFSECDDKIENNTSLLKLDKEGLLRQIRIYEKTIFIIEKKIENIYTLIERLKRGGECHRPE